MSAVTGNDTPSPELLIFISHSSRDKKTAELLTDLLSKALGLKAGAVVCTSVGGTGITAGKSIDDQLLRDIGRAREFVVLLSRSSLRSIYVAFEAGARWGMNKSIVPVLVPGSSQKLLEGPLGKRKALRADSESELQDLVSDLAAALALVPERPTTYHRLVKQLVGQRLQVLLRRFLLVAAIIALAAGATAGAYSLCAGSTGAGAGVAKQPDEAKCDEFLKRGARLLGLGEKEFAREWLLEARSVCADTSAADSYLLRAQ